MYLSPVLVCCMSVCGMHETVCTFAYVLVCGHTHMSALAYGYISHGDQKLKFRIILDHFSTLLVEACINQTQSLWTCLDQVRGSPWGSPTHAFGGWICRQLKLPQVIYIGSGDSCSDLYAGAATALTTEQSLLYQACIFQHNM